MDSLVQTDSGRSVGKSDQAPAHRSVWPRPISGWELIRDVVSSFQHPGFWAYGAWLDVSLRYRSQALGAFWIIAGTLVFVVALGTLYSQVLSEGSDLYFGHLACGYVLWIFMLRVLQPSSRLFASYKNMIENGYAKYTDYELRVMAQQCIIVAHNFVVVVGAMIFTSIPLTAAALVLVITIPLLLVTVLGAAFVISIIGARFADFGELLQSVLRLGFFVTPIIWMPGEGKGAIIGAFLYLNPFYYLIEIIRGPLIYGHVPWLEIGVTVAMALIVWMIASSLYARAKPYIPLWL